MGAHVSTFIQPLVSEEIRRLVADAVKKGGYLSASDAATQVARACPSCGLSERDIADEILSAAMAAGVDVKYRPWRATRIAGRLKLASAGGKS
jgi:hypothetical protein